MDWKQQTENLAIRTKEISDYFMTSTSQLDIDSLPEPSAFREASIAILELAEKIHKEHRLYIPGPDFNPTNILWRRTGAGLQPVLYDPIIRQDDNGRAEREQTNLVRAKFGMNPLEPPRF